MLTSFMWITIILFCKKVFVLKIYTKYLSVIGMIMLVLCVCVCVCECVYTHAHTHAHMFM